MDENLKKWIKRIVIIVALLIVVIVIANSRYSNPPGTNESISISFALADGFMVVGVLTFGFGALVRISATGFFDIFGYSAKAILNFFVPRFILKDEGGYYEYKVKKAEKRKELGVMREIIWFGLGFILLGIIFNLLVYI